MPRKPKQTPVRSKDRLEPYIQQAGSLIQNAKFEKNPRRRSILLLFQAFGAMLVLVTCANGPPVAYLALCAVWLLAVLFSLYLTRIEKG